MKKLICVLVSLTVLLTLGFSVIATQADEPQVLSELSDEEILVFLLENDIEVPVQFTSVEGGVAFARKVIEAVENDNNAYTSYGFKHLQDFHDAIVKAVLNHYGIYSICTLADIPADGLLYNVACGPWNESYGEYNCYGYAIAYYDWIAPGFLSEGIDPDSNYPGIMYHNLGTMASYVEADLVFRGYNIVSSGLFLNVPSGGVTAHKRVICFRWKTDENGYYEDFHFMCMGEDENWYHKPGSSVQLRYIHTPFDDDWVQEGLKSDGYYRNATEKYTGDIYYITYTINCNFRAPENSGGNPHLLICTGCGATKQESCTYEYQYNSGDTHILTCTVCGNTSGNAIRCVYRNNVCKTCGHSKISGGIIQSVRPQDDQ